MIANLLTLSSGDIGQHASVIIIVKFTKDEPKYRAKDERKYQPIFCLSFLCDV